MSRGPIGAGLLAGAVGTLAMDALWYQRARRQGSPPAFVTWEFRSVPNSFNDAPSPAKVARIAARSVGVELDPHWANAANNVVHWSTGVGWGVAAGLVAAATRAPALPVGVATGVSAWLTSYAVLPSLGVYRPLREYDWSELRPDLTAHVLYGAATGLALAVLTRRRRRSRR